MKTVAVVPMKLNNSRLPGKNTMSFTDGEPLCTYVLNTLSEVESIDEVYVYCSDPSIVEYLPASARYLRRSAELDRDSTTMNEVLLSFASEVPADVYVLAHATAPFISARSIGAGLGEVLAGRCDSAMSVRRLQGFMWLGGRPNYELGEIPRTQDIEPMFEETSGFYAFEAAVLLEHGRRVGFRPCMVEVSAVEAIDIDEKEDFEIADAVNSWLASGPRADGQPVGGAATGRVIRVSPLHRRVASEEA